MSNHILLEYIKLIWLNHLLTVFQQKTKQNLTQA